jgi:hypothetical protein
LSKWLRSLLAATGVATVLVGLLAIPAAAHDGASLASVRHATARFHDVDRAVAAGYGPLLACFDKPGVGGMGQHYAKGSLIDGTVTPTKPQALVYEVDGDELELVAVEYIILYSQLSPTAEAPRLFGQSFHHNDALSLWALHAWIWRHNPLGMFADYNPNVDLCPGHGETD